MKLLSCIIMNAWQLPQNLLGLLLLLYLRGESRHRLGSIRFYYSKGFPGCVTLGEYIIVGTQREITVKHEFGHILQSRYLGPLYLLVIGIPSLTWAGLRMIVPALKEKDYYSFYTEKWADKLGGVKRS